MPKSIKQLIRRDIDTYAPEWIDRQPVLLGDYTATVQTGTPGMFYTRQYNGKVIEVYNAANVPPTFDLHVIVGRKKSLPAIWQIIEIRETYLTPAGSGQIGYHHTQHEFPAGDTVWVRRKQQIELTVLVSDAAGFIVTVYGGVGNSTAGLTQVSTQFVDLSSYVVTAGAKFVSIETDEDGVLSLNEGVVFGAPEIATLNDVPAPVPGKGTVAAVLFYDGQSELSDDDILVPVYLGIVPKTSGLQIDEAAADTPADGDKFGFWDIVDDALKSITWANLKLAIKTYTDTLYSLLGHTHSAADVSFPVGHAHGLARWISSGGTTFDLPDLAEYLEGVSLNGLEEDPTLYSLSSDRTQVVFDSATTAADVVIATYVLAQV